MEWLEPQRYADALVLIGGKGGTLDAWFGALHDGLPRLPLGGTGRDAETAFKNTVRLWELIPVPGISKAQFEALGCEINSEADALRVTTHLVDNLLVDTLTAVDSRSRGTLGTAPSLFISYSRKDAEWVSRLRTLMNPLERSGLVSSWVDSDIEKGLPWEPQLLQRVEHSSAALLMVSPNFLNSEYVRTKEIPAFQRRLDAGNFRVFWILLETCDWQSVELLRKVQASDGIDVPLAQCRSAADSQCRLIEVVSSVGRWLDISQRTRTSNQ
ncbi:toll/interleukin-1 receptor domain-containing protein [Luteolibacter marinus]|uniref:toll/interleukin-1 receptor domain-containing protein n=1 Tax=Luteolibacter marinus TaxID=2776705 RepID=UPI0018667AAF|nr:toll/interleukin-1 receptor domain-containing protein [Luteolibacter marinus]